MGCVNEVADIILKTRFPEPMAPRRIHKPLKAKDLTEARETHRKLLVERSEGGVVFL